MNSFDYGDRISRLKAAMLQREIDVVFVTPSSDLRYLTGYEALPLERLTCLIVTKDSSPKLLVPLLERPAAQVHGLDKCDIELVSWTETEDPITLLARLTGSVKRAAVADTMWAQKALAIQQVLGVPTQAAGTLLSDLRAVKQPEEISAIAGAGAAIDSVHENMGQWLRPGRTEREVARDIADAIIASGHQTVDFVIVASGPNGASPHHECSDRVINAGEPVVVDIGGTMPNGYCSDCTRMYVCGEPSSDYVSQYAVLQEAQAAAVSGVSSGMSGREADNIAREILTEGGLGEYFVHRTGHGLGLDTHEEPYLVATNEVPLVNGNVFSIEPGFYIPGIHGARIEDIVALTDSGLINFNNTTHDLVILPA
ncbi:MAG: Xaa-Pro peptidase family protein [Actinomycetales bacterium]|nr:Xaa-Pro peptidase family protein [Actinomycetales bacterium]